MPSLKQNQSKFVEAATQEFPGATTINRDQIRALQQKHGFPWPAWLTGNKDYRAGRGIFTLPSAKGGTKTTNPTTKASFAERKPFVPTATTPEQVAVAAGTVDAPADAPTSWAMSTAVQKMIPEKLATFVPFGIHRDLVPIVQSGLFYPVFITGLSGNGKTETVSQVCADAGREMFLVSVTCETDEDDLLGGFRLVAGETKWQNGPVVEAMERGAILLLDELDYASQKIACLQSVLTGKGVYLKKINRWISPKPGFSVIATANTKGKGDENGRFVGTNVLNEAFLDRFPCTLEQDYPPEKVERKIVSGIMAAQGTNDTEFVDRLVAWSGQIRKAFNENAVEEVVTTRRLIQIVTAYAIFRDRLKAIEVCTARFDDATKESFLNFYKAIDDEATKKADPIAAAAAAGAKTPEVAEDDCPF